MNHNFQVTWTKTCDWVKTNSPAILTGTGIVLNGLSIYLAIKSAKLEEKKTGTIKEDLVKTQEKIANNELTKEEGKKEKSKLYKALVKEYVKLYGPCLLSFGLSATATIASHKIHKHREVILAGAVTSLEQAFESYRKKVAEATSEEEEKEIYNEAKKTVNEVSENAPKDETPSDYSYLFDEANVNWSKNGNGNISWLMQVQQNLNSSLNRKGYLFLYEVYNALGVDIKTLTPVQIAESRKVGWLSTRWGVNHHLKSNGFVSLGISDENNYINTNRYADMMYGASGMWLHFNPDGNILTGSDTGGVTFIGYAKGHTGQYEKIA